MSATPYHLGAARHILLIDEDPTTLMILENLPEPADDKWLDPRYRALKSVPWTGSFIKRRRPTRPTYGWRLTEL